MSNSSSVGPESDSRGLGTATGVACSRGDREHARHRTCCTGEGANLLLPTQHKYDLKVVIDASSNAKASACAEFFAAQVKQAMRSPLQPAGLLFTAAAVLSRPLRALGLA